MWRIESPRPGQVSGGVSGRLSPKKRGPPPQPKDGEPRRARPPRARFSCINCQRAPPRARRLAAKNLSGRGIDLYLAAKLRTFLQKVFSPCRKPFCLGKRGAGDPHCLFSGGKASRLAAIALFLAAERPGESLKAFWTGAQASSQDNDPKIIPIGLLVRPIDFLPAAKGLFPPPKDLLEGPADLLERFFNSSLDSPARAPLS